MNMRAIRASVAGLVGGVLVGGGFVAVAAQAPAARDVKVCVTAKRTVVASSPKGRCPKGTKRTTISRRGPAGPAGARGATGATGATGRSTAGSAAELIAARLDAGVGNVTMVALGESTTDQPTEWWARYTRALGRMYPKVRVVYVEWNRDTLTYKPGQVVQEGDGTQTLYSFNGSRSGASYDYHRSNFAALFPSKPDVVYLAASHANRLMDGPTYAARVQQMADTVTARFPGTLFVAFGSNPQYAPRAANGIAAQLSRITELRVLAARNDWDYIPGMEAFRARPDGQSLVEQVDENGNPDGIHPTQSGADGTPSGAQLLADTALKLIQDKSLAPPTP